MTRPRLAIVTDEPIDIAAAIRADILMRDWSACHVAGDRAVPLRIGERVKRMWRK
jgi:hypothetical protein